MGCINVKVSTGNSGINVTSKVNKPIAVVVTQFAGDCNVECSCTKGINVTTNIVPISNIIVTPHIKGISVKCGIVCSLADVLYVRVSPQEVQWITEDEVIVYNVESNTNWIIE
jgi:hypothetical protein